MIGVYIFYNLVYAICSYPAGILADKLGMKKVLVYGIFIYAMVYSGMAFAKQGVLFFLLFFLYGMYAAATEGVAKAWISNICEREKTATAIGTYTAFQSVATLLASSMAGLIWYTAGASYAFMLSALAAVVVGLMILRIRSR